MHTVKLDDLELEDVWSDADPSLRSRDAFPLSWGRGTRSSAVVVFELRPGCHLGLHRHSAEEVVLVLEGEVEVTVDGERACLERGALAVAPALAPHDVRNVGGGDARCLGFYSSAAVTSVYEETLMPEGERVTGTPTPEDLAAGG